MKSKSVGTILKPVGMILKPAGMIPNSTEIIRKMMEISQFPIIFYKKSANVILKPAGLTNHRKNLAGNPRIDTYCPSFSEDIFNFL